MRKLLSIFVCFMMGFSLMSISVKKASAQTVQVNGTQTMTYDLQAGYYILDLSGNQACKATLYLDSTYIVSANSASNYENEICPTFQVTISGTYTLQLDTSGQNIAVNVNLYKIEKGGNLSLNGTKSGTSGMNSNEIAYYKVTTKKTGVLSFTISGVGSTYSSSLIVCNSKKKSMTGSVGYVKHGQKIQIGLRKGTYYLGIKSINKSYVIKTAFTTRNELGGTNQKKAKVLKKNKTYYTTLTAGRKTYWFKYNNTKASKINVTFKSSIFCGGSGYYAIYAHYNKQKHLLGFLNEGDHTYKGNIYTTNYIKSKKANKGTFYIELIATGKTTGTTSLKIS